ncbi:helix-turn-helix domain-containing protein [Streptomyces microflavus]
MSPSSSARVQEARDRIAIRLRGLRSDAGLTGQQLAELAGWQGSKVSRLQSGRSQPSDEDIRAWCRACGAEGEAENLIAASRQAHHMYTEWRRVQGRGLRGVQEARTPRYERTKVIRVYSSKCHSGDAPDACLRGGVALGDRPVQPDPRRLAGRNRRTRGAVSNRPAWRAALPDPD